MDDKIKTFHGAGGNYFGNSSKKDTEFWNQLKKINGTEKSFDSVGHQNPNFDMKNRERHKKGGRCGKDDGGEIAPNNSRMLGTTVDSKPPIDDDDDDDEGANIGVEPQMKRGGKLRCDYPDKSLHKEMHVKRGKDIPMKRLYDEDRKATKDKEFGLKRQVDDAIYHKKKWRDRDE